MNSYLRERQRLIRTVVMWQLEKPWAIIKPSEILLTSMEQCWSHIPLEEVQDFFRNRRQFLQSIVSSSGLFSPPALPATPNPNPVQHIDEQMGAMGMQGCWMCDFRPSSVLKVHLFTAGLELVPWVCNKQWPYGIRTPWPSVGTEPRTFSTTSL